MKISRKLKYGGIAFIVFVAFFFVFFIIFLFPKKSRIIQNNTQTGLSLKTELISNFKNEILLEKPGRVLSSQDILVTAQANGKISRLLAKEGDSVKGGQPIVQLADTIASYKLQTERAKNGLDRALLLKEQTELTLNQTIQQAENAYKTAEQNFKYAQESSVNAVKQAGIGLSGADSQFDALKNSFSNQKIALLNILNSLLEVSDSLLGVTDYYEDQLKGQEIYLGAKDQSQKNEAKEFLRSLYKQKEKVDGIADIPLNGSGIFESAKLLNTVYDEIFYFSHLMVEVLKNSIPSEGTLGEGVINRHIQTFQNFESGPGVQQAKGTFIGYYNQVKSQISGETTLSQENAELTYKNTLNNAENSLFQSEIALKNAKINYETLLANKDIQLELLGNAVVDAKIAYESALVQYNKLQVRSPVTGVIGQVLVSEGQEVAMGTPVFDVSGKSKQQIEVYVSAEEYRYILDREPVEIEYQNQTFTGVIDTIGSVADKTNLFKVIIQFSIDIPLLGEIAKVKFPITLGDNTILPLEEIKILNDNEGEIAILSNGKEKRFPVKIKKVWGSYAELAEKLSGDVQIILNK